MLANSAGYFNIGARDEASATIEKTGKVVVPEPEPGPDPEPTYTVVDETDMLADTKNWTLGYDSPTFASGSITAKTETDFSIGGYNKPVKLNTVYRFRYKNVRGTGWYDGFYLGFSPANIYWSDGGVQVDFNGGSTALHFYKAATEDAEGNPVYQPVLNTAQSPSIVSGQEYEIEFGLLKVSDDTVKVHLTINGTPYFADVEVKDSVFVTKPLYFGIFSRGSEATISSMEYSVVDVTDMLEDTTNWTSAGWGDPLTVADGTVTAKTAEGYSIGGYNKPVKLNTVYRFKYMHKRGSGAAGFAFNFAANDVYWNGGIQVDFNSESAAVHYVEGQNVPVFDADQTFKAEDDMVYDIEFAVLQLAENTVKVYLTINGTPFFTDKNAVENAIFVTKPLYFGIYASSATATISKPDTK